MYGVHLLTFNEVSHAVPLKERLVKAGIRAKIQNERTIQHVIFMSPALASVHLFVDHAHVEQALALLREWHQRDGSLSNALHCPQCGSSRVHFPQVTRKIASAWMFSLVCALGIFKRKFYCKDCHFTWPAKEYSEPPRDILGWPKKRESKA